MVEILSFSFCIRSVLFRGRVAIQDHLRFFPFNPLLPASNETIARPDTAGR
jgi:hypothetical protein